MNEDELGALTDPGDEQGEAPAQGCAAVTLPDGTVQYLPVGNDGEIIDLGGEATWSGA